MKLQSIANKRILLSPLNWGMGHVSRCIGLAEKLLEQQNELFIACDPIQQQVFESYYPGLNFIEHTGYPFEFLGKGNFGSDLFNNRKQLLSRFASEQKEVESYVNQYQIDFVISDHRYGFFSKKVPSVFLTHQIHLPLKWFQFPVQWVHRRFMRQFTCIWCLDTEDQLMAGKLSAPIPQFSIEYTGFFSRFSPGKETEAQYDFLFVISGPEPYAEQFFREIMDQYKDKPGKMVCLSPEKYPGISVPNHIELVTATDWKTNDLLFYQSKVIVSRAGYSTLMDLEVLGKKAILIPTPGQAEQIYLDKLHADRFR